MAMREVEPAARCTMCRDFFCWVFVAISLIVFILCILAGDLPDIIIAFAGVAITMGFTGTGSLKDLFDYRRELKHGKVEIERLKRKIDDLKAEVKTLEDKRPALE